MKKNKEYRENKQLNIDDIKKKTNVPTGKVYTAEQLEKKRKERIENRIRARCNRLGIDGEEKEKLIKAALERNPNHAVYDITVMFHKNNRKMIEQICINNSIKPKYVGDYYMFIRGNMELVAKLKNLLPAENTSYHLYKIREKIEKIEKAKKPSNNSKSRATAAKAARKAINLMKFANRKKQTTLADVVAVKNNKMKKAA